MDDEPYDLLPHHEIEELKRQVQDLKNSRESSSSQSVVNALEQLTNTMDSMLKLFNEAAHEVKADEKEHSEIINKLDEIIEQNRTIAEGMVTISDTVKDFINSHKHRPHPRPMPGPVPGPNFQQQAPDFPQFDEMPRPKFNEPMPPGRQGPVAMPSMPFSDIDLGEKPKKKKGIFGRLKK